ncbi:MAG: hypothetical protein IT233_04365 [Bacteroidia bacterium]|nr:hypothetical protein [Bacteroidia bacterium]
MLPFSSADFFIWMAAMVLLVQLTGRLLPKEGYMYLIAGCNLLFVVLFFPDPLLLSGFIAYTYLILHFIIPMLNFRLRIWGILILLVPMILVKLDIRFHVYPFELNRVLSFAGLSYASFRVVGYYMDQKPGDPAAHPVSWLNFLCFTPTLLIGPIDRYRNYFRNEAEGKSALSWENLEKGMERLLIGVFFKFICAELISRYWLNAFPSESRQISHLVSGMSAYYLYLFFDFAGYSWMALGTGKMLGMTVPVNFTNPFLSLNPPDFWRRFHVSLGEWLKDYFFSPLYYFLTKKERLRPFPLLRQNTAIFLTFLLMGAWNGFSLHFILSGALFGLYSVIHNIYLHRCRKKGKDVLFGNLPPAGVRILSRIIMFVAVSFSLYIFSGKFPW